MVRTNYPPAILLLGPTASGKTGAAVFLRSKLPIEIISVDSALVFRDMDIGTAKPDAATLQAAPHHLIDVTTPMEPYSAAQFRADALRLMTEITARGKIPLLVGGTMMYFKALEEGLSDLPQADAEVRAQLDAEAARIGWPGMHEKLAKVDPQTAARLKVNDSQRIQRALEIYQLTGQPMSAMLARQQSVALPYDVLKIALVPSDRKVLHALIAERFAAMLKQGLIDEVRRLQEKYPALTPESTAMRCVGYRQVLEYLRGEYDADELLNRGIYATRQLAKRQLTWLRGMENVVQIDCLNPDVHEIVLRCVMDFIQEPT